MRIRIRFLALVTMLCSALTADSRNQLNEPFCFHTKTAFGRIQCSFLRKSASLLFYWTIWTVDHQVEECSITAETAVIQNYMKSCHEERTCYSNLTRLNISLLLEPGSPCKFRPGAVSNWLLHRRTLDLGNQAGARTRQKRSWVLPGTLWCGRGSRARNYEQLGMFEHVDGCCREHDHCSHVIRPFTVNFGVFNPSFFTISHCECDHRFKQCLLNVNDSVSNMVGYTFFNILKLRCFDLIQKRHCTQLNWFGMCTSVQVAPFAILKTPISYNFKNSNPGTSGISSPPGYQMQISANGKGKIKPKQRRKQTKALQRNNTVAPTRGNTFLHEKMQQRYGKNKKISPRTTILPPLWKITTRPSSPTVHNLMFLHQKNQTKNKLRMFSVHQFDLMDHITPPPGPARVTPIHTTLSWPKKFSTQKTLFTPMKEIPTNRKKTTTYPSQNITVNMMQNHKPPTSNQSRDSKVPLRDFNFQSTQQKGKDWNVGKASKLKSLYATPSPNFLKTYLVSTFPSINQVFVNGTTQPTKKTSFPSKTNACHEVSKHPKQKIKGSHSKNKFTNITNKTRNQTRVTLMPTTEPRSTLRKDINLSSKISWGAARFNNPSFTKQKAVSSVMEKCTALNNSSIASNATETATTTSITPRQKSISVLEQTTSSTETTKSLSSSLWNETKSTHGETSVPSSVCDAVRYLDDCKYKIRPMEKINGHYNKESTTIYHCDCLYRLTDHLKQLKKDKKNSLESLLGKFVSLSCIEIPNLKECKKAISCPVILLKTTEHDSSQTKTDKDQVTAKNTKQLINKRAPGRLYKHCLRILNPRNPKHVKKGPSFP